jgi:hypothetical protein
MTGAHDGAGGAGSPGGVVGEYDNGNGKARSQHEHCEMFRFGDPVPWPMRGRVRSVLSRGNRLYAIKSQTTARTPPSWGIVVKVLLTFLTSPTIGFLLKLFTGIAAAGFGLFGFGIDGRDKETRKLTRNGRIAFVGIVVAGCLAIATSIYDFAAGQAQTESARSEREALLLSVQRPTYPLQKAKVSFSIRLRGDYAGLKAYKQQLRRVVNRDRQCVHQQPGLWCYYANLSGGIDGYKIDRTSPFFPRPSSQVRRVLENLEIFVGIAHPTPDSVAPRRNDSAFEIEWPEGIPPHSQLVYDRSDDTVTLVVDDYPLHDDQWRLLNAQSLIDLLGDLIAVFPGVLDDRLCAALKMASPDCETQVLDPLLRGSSVGHVEFAFSYPKTIRVDPEHATPCTLDGRTALVLRLPNDIGLIGPLGLLAPDRPDEAICRALDASSRNR